LDLDEQEIDRILDPTNFEMLAIERAILDFAAVVVGHERAVGQPARGTAAVGKALTLLIARRWDEIARPPVDRHGELAGRKPRAVDDRLIVAGQESGGVT
jgi:hypothetical protein